MHFFSKNVNIIHNILIKPNPAKVVLNSVYNKSKYYVDFVVLVDVIGIFHSRFSFNDFLCVKSKIFYTNFFYFHMILKFFE